MKKEFRKLFRFGSFTRQMTRRLTSEGELEKKDSTVRFDDYEYIFLSFYRTKLTFKSNPRVVDLGLIARIELRLKNREIKRNRTLF